MRRYAWALAWALAIAASTMTLMAMRPSSAQAQRAPRETGQRLSRPRVPSAPAGPAVSAPAPRPRWHQERGAGLAAPAVRAPRELEPPQKLWTGPRVELSYARYVLDNPQGGGLVHAGAFGGYVPAGVVRLGAWGELGVRRYPLGPDDLIARANAIFGYQQVWGLQPVVPYFGVVGTAGIVVGKRFHTTVHHRILGAGLEVGADVNLVQQLWTGLSFSWVRTKMRGLSFDLFILRVRLGL